MIRMETSALGVEDMMALTSLASLIGNVRMKTRIILFVLGLIPSKGFFIFLVIITIVIIVLRVVRFLPHDVCVEQ